MLPPAGESASGTSRSRSWAASRLLSTGPLVARWDGGQNEVDCPVTFSAALKAISGPQSSRRCSSVPSARFFWRCACRRTRPELWPSIWSTPTCAAFLRTAFSPRVGGPKRRLGARGASSLTPPSGLLPSHSPLATQPSPLGEAFPRFSLPSPLCPLPPSLAARTERATERLSAKINLCRLTVQSTSTITRRPPWSRACWRRCFRISERNSATPRA